ncbi:hypothetical protein EBQ91_00540, partial [bacterium]|nr:hypothetical protein [bacterium]
MKNSFRLPIKSTRSRFSTETTVLPRPDYGIYAPDLSQSADIKNYITPHHLEQLIDLVLSSITSMLTYPLKQLLYSLRSDDPVDAHYNPAKDLNALSAALLHKAISEALKKTTRLSSTSPEETTQLYLLFYFSSPSCGMPFYCDQHFANHPSLWIAIRLYLGESSKCGEAIKKIIARYQHDKIIELKVNNKKISYNYELYFNIAMLLTAYSEWLTYDEKINKLKLAILYFASIPEHSELRELSTFNIQLLMHYCLPFHAQTDLRKHHCSVLKHIPDHSLFSVQREIEIYTLQHKHQEALALLEKALLEKISSPDFSIGDLEVFMTETEIDRQSIIPYIFIQKMRMNVDFISSLLCNKIINGNADCTNDQKKIMKNIFDDLLIYTKIRVNFINESDMNAFILNLVFVFSIIYPEMFDECIASMDIIALKDFTLENIRALKAIESDKFTPGNELYNKVQNINESDYKKIVFSVDEASLLSVIMSQQPSLDAVIIEDYELYKNFIDIKMKMQGSYDEKMKGFFEKIRQDVFSEPEDKHVNVDEQKLSEIIYDEYYSIWLFRWFMTEIFADIQKNNQGKKESLFNALQDRGLNKTEIFYIIT